MKTMFPKHAKAPCMPLFCQDPASTILKSSFYKKKVCSIPRISSLEG